MVSRNDIMQMVSDELANQDKKWGAGRILSKELWVTILGEEFGEVCKARLEHDPGGYIQEMIQVAAVAISAIQSAFDETD